MILDLLQALAERLEPDLDPEQRVVLDMEPLTWEKDHLYVYQLRVDEVPLETGPTRQQNFMANAVWITDSPDEAQLRRDPEVAQFLDGKRGQYMTVVRHARPEVGLWDHLQAVADDARPRGLDKRSAAVRVSGWRIVN